MDLICYLYLLDMAGVIVGEGRLLDNGILRILKNYQVIWLHINSLDDYMGVGYSINAHVATVFYVAMSFYKIR